MRTRLILVTLACALAGRARADVLVVGPAPAFPSIQAAVNAAQDGDIVLVKGGTWPSFSIVDRALAIVADDGAVVNVSGAILVANLAATRDVVLSGLRATGMLAVFPQNVYGLHASNCAGSLRVQDCELRGGPALPYDYCALRPDGALVQSCQDVVFTRTVLEGVDYTTLNVPPGLGSQRGGGHGLFAHSSRVALYGCALAGGYGFLDVLTCSGYDEDGAPGGHGLLSIASFVFAASSDLRGGGGGDALPGECGDGGNGGAGGRTSSAIGTYALDVVALGGAAGVHQVNPLDPFCNTHDGRPGQPWSGNGATVLGGPARSCVATRVAREGGLVTLSLHGVPGDVVELAVADTTGFRFLVGARGVDTLHRARSLGAVPVTTLGTVPPGGVLTTSWTVPDLGPGVPSAVLHLQPAFTSTTGTVTLGTPQSIVLLDAAF